MVSRVWLSATSWTIACQAPLSTELSRQEYWSGLPFPTPGDLPNPGIKPVSPASPASAGGFFTTRATWEAQYLSNVLLVLFLCRTQTNRFQVSSSFSREIKKVLKQPYFQSMRFFFFCMSFCHELQIILNNSDAVGSSFSRFLMASVKVIKQFWRNSLNICFTLIPFSFLIFNVLPNSLFKNMILQQVNTLTPLPWTAILVAVLWAHVQGNNLLPFIQSQYTY